MEKRETETVFPSKGFRITIEGVSYNHRRDAIDGIIASPRRNRDIPKKAPKSPFDWNRCSATLDDEKRAFV